MSACSTTRHRHSRPDHAGSRPGSWRDPISFLLQVGLVVGVEVSDDLFHALQGQNDVAVALTHATQIARLESRLGLWVEPAVQTAFLQPTHLLGLEFGAGQFAAIFNTIYGLGHVVVTLCFALWVFLRRRALFRVLRNTFLLTSVLALIVKETFPLAPPRLSAGLQYHGRPFHFADTVFGQGGGVQVGFNQYAAMPSLHIAWALLVGLGLAWMAHSRLLRLLGALYPCLMLIAVIVSGNHYLMDGVGSLIVVGIAVLAALMLEKRRGKASHQG